MPASDITIKGAREHNLRDVDIVLPRNQLICLTGVSGSGKSSLAFDTLFAEGQRRYVESLSTFARQFLGQMPKPDVDYIGGLSPSISISQKSTGHNPRSTVGTVTEIYDYLRVLFARVGQGCCPKCGAPITAQSREQILASIQQLPPRTKFSLLAPLIRGQKGEYRDLFEDLLKQGFVRARVDGKVVALTDDLKLDRQMRHNIEVVIDRLVMRPDIRPRLAEAVELALKMGQGNLIVSREFDGETPSATSSSGGASGVARGDEGDGDDEGDSGIEGVGAGEAQGDETGSFVGLAPTDTVYSSSYACTPCGLSFETPSPQLFSFNSPQGMCRTCDGLGTMFSFSAELLVPNPRLTFKDGCFELIGSWRDLGRWRRHIYQGVADSIERKRSLAAGTMLETPWERLDAELQQLWLWGTGDEHITFTWRGGAAPMKYGGRFGGIVPELLEKYKTVKSKPMQWQLEKYMTHTVCPDCRGQRLLPQARAVKVETTHPRFADSPVKSLPDVCDLSIRDAVDYFSDLRLDPTRTLIAAEALKEIRARLGFLMNVGLDYLTLARTAPTLSGGESQRIRLASQIGSGLVGVLYILDEPSIGLHPRDNDRLLATLHRLRDMGNTVVVVEHDEDTMRAADHIVDFGPGPGVRGGEVVASGRADEIAAVPRSLTGAYLSGERRIEVPATRRPIGENKLRVLGAAHNNLKNVDVEIPLGAFVCVTGVSGSGKSSLVNDILVEALHRDLNKGEGNPGVHRAIEGLEHLDKLIDIDQSPIGRTPRSNPATYIKVFDDIRDLFTQLPDAKTRGYKPGRFSFNVSGGRCEACEGNGSNRLEMDFLADVWVTCPVCEGRRFNRETLQVKFKGKSITDVLEMDIQQALALFENVPQIRHKLQTLHDVGLDYLKLGQPSPTLSGGEAQRVKLARELVKKSTGKTLYLLDEPTTGLHFADIQLLLKVLHDFVDAGNTVLVVEHNLDVIKTADWIIDLGPEGGAAGGRIVTTGRPEEIVLEPASHTGRSLAPILAASRGPSNVAASAAARKSSGGAGSGRSKNGAKSVEGEAATMGAVAREALASREQLTVRGARQHNLKGVDVTIARDKMTVFCGPSGSGKSSLAMDTIYAEGQRRYVESLSAYARQFVAQMQKPQLDHIDGLSPAIAIEQKNLGHTPRSTVGTVTEIYDYLRILLARLGTPYCPGCDRAIGTQTSDEVVDKVMAHPAGTKLYLMAPLAVEVGQKYETLWDELRAAGYIRVRIDGFTHSLDKPPEIDRRRQHRVEVVVDRISVQPAQRSRIADSVEKTLALGKGILNVAYPNDEIAEPRWEVVSHSQHLACDKCGRSFEPLTPHSFSFNTPLGWCTACEGLGVQRGANPTALVRDPKLTLAEGALLLWPDLAHPLARAMLRALGRETGLALDVPFEQLDARHRRLVLHGTGEQWFTVRAGDLPASDAKSAEKGVGDVTESSSKGKKSSDGKKASSAAAERPVFRFQFKGLYPALEEASHLSPTLRGRLEQLVAEVECSTCSGSRLRDAASAARFRDLTIDSFCRMPLGKLHRLIADWNLSTRERKIAGELLREIQNRVQFLVDVGLEYLSLNRPAATLSNGEAQRIRLASQLGSGLCGVLYVLDEPTIGLHPRDNRRLLDALHKLRDLGNTLIVVEHDRDVIRECDYLCDFGPGAGKHGGQIVADGSPEQVTKRRGSVTGPYLSGKKTIPIPSNRRAVRSNEPRPKLEIVNARHNNLRGVSVEFPLGTLVAVTGPSGSGKSSLIEDVLYASLARTLHRASVIPGAHDAIRGLEHINKVIRVDQQPIGNSPTSNPATYTGVFDLVRQLFSQLPEAKLRGYSGRRFSFNVPGGRCEACEGNGQKRIEMHFLPDVWVECDTCRGRRYTPETLAVTYHGRSISDVLDMTCGEAAELFRNIPKIRRILQTLCDVGLDYLTLGQAAPTLSGGEAQRVKLAAELSRPDTGRTLYLLDEPTTGLHFDDIAKLLEVLHRLVDLGNTVVVIEHNLDVIKQCDWVIDLGPEAGAGGGSVVAQGTPEEIVAHARRAASGVAVGVGDATGAAEVQATIVARGTAKSDKGEKSEKSRKNAKGAKSAKAARAAEAAAVAESAVGSTAASSAATAAGSSSGSLLVSHTGEALAEVMNAADYAERKRYQLAEELKADDLDIDDVGRDAKMPWEVDGRRWHTRDRVGRTGEPCRWDGRILEQVVDRIHDQGEFAETNWDSRSVVEITAKKKSDGWFFHAITGETWLLKLKFRVARSTFQRDSLLQRIALKTLNEMHELPVYGNEPRVKCKNLRGPWQEVEIRVHALEEVDTPEFWSFIDEAVAGFNKFTERAALNPEDLAPWKVLGQKWHFLRKGFPPGKKIEWEAEVLEELCEMLTDAAPGGQFLWNNQQLVHYIPAGRRDPWATVLTKKPETLILVLTGPKNAIGFGRVAELGCDRELMGEHPKHDHIKIHFREADDLHRGDLAELLEEHFKKLS